MLVLKGLVERLFGRRRNRERATDRAASAGVEGDAGCGAREAGFTVGSMG